QDVVDAGALEDGAHRTAGDDARSGAGRLEQHHTGRVHALHRVRDRLGDPRHLEEVLLGLLDALGDGGRHLLGLAVADADRAVTVADDDQRGEAEAPATLHDLGDPVDRDDPLEMRRLLGGRVAAAAFAPVVPAAATLGATGPAAPALLTRHEFNPSW